MPRYDTTEISNKWARAMLPGGRDPEAEQADDYVTQRLGRSARRAIPPDSIEQLIMAMVMSELAAQQEERRGRSRQQLEREEYDYRRQNPEQPSELERQRFTRMDEGASLENELRRLQIEAAKKQLSQNDDPVSGLIRDKDRARQAAGFISDEQKATPTGQRFAQEGQTDTLVQRGAQELRSRLDAQIDSLPPGFDMSKASPHLLALVGAVDTEYPDADENTRAQMKAALQGHLEKRLAERTAQSSGPRDASRLQLHVVRDRQGHVSRDPIDPADPPLIDAADSAAWLDPEEVNARNDQYNHARRQKVGFRSLADL